MKSLEFTLDGGLDTAVGGGEQPVPYVIQVPETFSDLLTGGAWPVTGCMCPGPVSPFQWAAVIAQ